MHSQAHHVILITQVLTATQFRLDKLSEWQLNEYVPSYVMLVHNRHRHLIASSNNKRKWQMVKKITCLHKHIYIYIYNI